MRCGIDIRNLRMVLSGVYLGRVGLVVLDGMVRCTSETGLESGGNYSLRNGVCIILNGGLPEYGVNFYDFSFFLFLMG